MKCIIKKIDPEIEYHEFSNGESLLIKLKELDGCTAVFTDQNMGDGMSGLEITEEIRRLKIKCKIYIIANEHKSYFEEKALKAGADSYFIAPIGLEDLKKILR